MRTQKPSFVLMLSALFVGPVMAEDDPAGRPERGEFRQEILEAFDEDGNGQLDNGERINAREKMRGRRGKEGAKGHRRGEGPPNPEELFERFDTNGDNQLSREEFRKLAKSMREHHEKRHAKHHQGKGPRGEGSGRRPGPPGEDRRDFRPSGPLQNPGDRPPRAGKGRRGGGPEGPGGRDFEGRHRPSPDKIFDRFDKNDDGQLSREEFGKLSRAMREMRDRFHGEKGKKFGKDHGGRRGPEGS
ncbi:MAG: hypothetical protein GXP28_06015 [Planctomycetes bacterium]|nr:hypothetical protein [Planctomycetota bacterium]